jgi:hypothetical protein
VQAPSAQVALSIRPRGFHGYLVPRRVDGLDYATNPGPSVFHRATESPKFEVPSRGIESISISITIQIQTLTASPYFEDARTLCLESTP